MGGGITAPRVRAGVRLVDAAPRPRAPGCAVLHDRSGAASSAYSVGDPVATVLADLGCRVSVRGCLHAPNQRSGSADGAPGLQHSAATLGLPDAYADGSWDLAASATLTPRSRSLLEEARERRLIGSRRLYMDEIADHMQNDLADLDVEVVRVLYNDVAGTIIGDDLVAIGSVSRVDPSIRHVFERGFDLGAATTVMVHNHPSGDAKASSADIEFTRMLITASSLVKMPLSEHIVVARGGSTRIRYQKMI